MKPDKKERLSGYHPKSVLFSLQQFRFNHLLGMQMLDEIFQQTAAVVGLLKALYPHT